MYIKFFNGEDILQLGHLYLVIKRLLLLIIK